MNNKPYIIQLTSVTGSRKPKYLASLRVAKERVLGKDCRSRITRTDLRDAARGFATLEEAQKFRDEYAPFFMCKWEVIARTTGGN